MGTEITLDAAGTILTYSKNSTGIDHGMLFQDSDRIDFGGGNDRLNDWQFGEAFVRPREGTALALSPGLRQRAGASKL